MENLETDLASCFMDSVGYDAVRADLPGETELTHVKSSATCEVGGDASCNHEPDSTACAFYEVLGHAFITILCLFQTRVHGAHEDSVFEACEPKVERT
jgi:hypothetical protein